MARKGKDKSDRPHRYATIIEGGTDPKPVKLEQLQEFAPKPISKPTKDIPAATSESGFLDVRGYLEHYGKKILDEKPHGSAILYVLEKCLFNPEHGKKEAAVGQCDDGTLFYQCFHNSCKKHTWHEARQKISGDDGLAEFMNTNSIISRDTTNIQQTYTIISANDLVNKKIKASPIINGVMMETDNLLIVGESGIGKSMLTLNLAFNLGLPGENKSLWDFSTIPHMFITLFIQSENSKAGTNNRIKLMLKGKSQYGKATCNVYFPWVNKDCRISGNLLDPSFQSFVKEFTLTTGAKVLIFDPLISFHQGNENDNAEMQRVLNALTRICIDTETSPIVVHHTGKSEASWSGGGRGASSIGGWADNIIRISHAKPKDPQHLLITHQKSRNFPEMPPFVLERTGSLDFTKVRKNRSDASEDLVRKPWKPWVGRQKLREPW
jgi:hypothetical protein